MICMSQSSRQIESPTTDRYYGPFETKSGENEASHSIDLFTIGSMLRARREKKGASVADAAEALFVKKSTLCDIERGRWEALPHPVYVKGYVKSYASYLGVLETIEACLYAPPKTMEEENLEHDKGVPSRTTGLTSTTAPLRPFISRIGLICTSVAGVLLGLAISSATQVTAVVSLKDVLVGCHLAIAGVRRIVLP
jgi:transcriptional regulator with XRE-family HTH domain